MQIQKKKPGANPGENHSHCGLAYHGGHVYGLRGALELPGDLHVHLLGIDVSYCIDASIVRHIFRGIILNRRHSHSRGISDSGLSSTDLFATVPGARNRRQFQDKIIGLVNRTFVPFRMTRRVGNGSDADTVQGIYDLLCDLDGAVTPTDTEQSLAVARLHVENRHVQKTENHRGDKHLRDTETFLALY